MVEEHLDYGTTCRSTRSSSHAIACLQRQPKTTFIGLHVGHDASRLPPQGRWRISGLGLSDTALRTVYYQNAERVLSDDYSGRCSSAFGAWRLGGTGRRTEDRSNPGRRETETREQCPTMAGKSRVSAALRLRVAGFTMRGRDDEEFRFKGWQE